jgi:electron transport complex protein RnfE
MTLGGIREILGNGSLFNLSLFGPNFEPWVIMILPPGGFLGLGLILLFFNWIKERKDASAPVSGPGGQAPVESPLASGGNR